ncbi:MAG: roadblock/LC7 domain-containing protein [Gammaproteobacteria bacterium]|nr:roadblock/LC7 domain-containing protein [Gammaproteobacteria bacterium]
MGSDHVNDDQAVIPVFLVPTPDGARYALASGARDARRGVLLGLLRGGAQRPVPLGEVAEWADLPDRRSAGALVFKMQREALISGETQPLSLPASPRRASVSRSLAELAGDGAAVLGEGDGLCLAHSGLSRPDAERIAALSAALYPLYRRQRWSATGDDAFVLSQWRLVADDGRTLVVRHLRLGRHLFHLAAVASDERGDVSLVRLAALMSRWCLGTC